MEAEWAAAPVVDDALFGGVEGVTAENPTSFLPGDYPADGHATTDKKLPVNEGNHIGDVPHRHTAFSKAVA